MDLQPMKNKMIILEEPEIEIEPEKKEPEIHSDDLSIDPFASVNMFKKKEKIEKVPIIEKPLIIDKKTKKKRILSEAHKASLERGRIKGLETRRLNRLKKKQEKEALKNKGKKPEVIDINPIKTPEISQEPIQIVKKIQEQPILRKEMEKTQYKQNPEDEFKKFYTMMDRYQNIKHKQYSIKQQKLKQQQLIKQQQLLKQQQLKKEQEKLKVKKQKSLYGNRYGNRYNNISSNDTTDYTSYFT